MSTRQMVRAFIRPEKEQETVLALEGAGFPALTKFHVFGKTLHDPDGGKRAMKEIWAIIRRNNLPATRKALEEIGYPAMSVHSVEGRGRQGGALFKEIDPYVPEHYEGVVKVKPTPSAYALTHTLTKAVTYVPKRLLVLVVPDEAEDKVRRAIMEANRTGHPGDGKIFVLPVEEAIRIRTDERGAATVA